MQALEFEEFFKRATGAPPYPWQRRVAEEGLPEVIDVETGAGKTAGVVLAWLHRLHRDPDRTPPWLVFALPMRSLVDQTHQVITAWMERLDDDDLAVYRLLGGEGRLDAGWRERPGQRTIIVGTVDMLLSRALMRGFASSRWMWPLEYGLLHAGTHWVFDEVQLLGPALATGRQLDAFRRRFGTAAPCSSTWMSATLDAATLVTVDNAEVPAPLTLTDADRREGLAKRLDATRVVGERAGTTPKEVASVVLDAHEEGSLTLVVVNLVKRAQDIHAELAALLRRRSDGHVPELALLHSRFRPDDRQRVVDDALGTEVDPAGPGRILVATQVVEAGVDVSARTLVTDLAPWSSIVQRAGRCNRAGEWDDGEAHLLWVTPLKPEPYKAEDLGATAEALRALEGEGVTSSRLRLLGREVAQRRPVVPVLRRRDLLELFDTSPDLVGADVEVSRFIREDDDTDVQVAWRDPVPALAAVDAFRQPFLGGRIRPEELCRVGIVTGRKWLAGVVAWTPDPLREPVPWRRVTADRSSVRPGAVVVVSSASGGYDPRTGWDGTTPTAVPVIPEKERHLDGDEVAPIDEATKDDPASFVGGWVRLDDHLTDTARAAVAVVEQAGMGALSESHRRAVVRAAALHDIGKAHPVFQATMRRSAGPDPTAREAVERLVPIAKSGGRRSVRHEREHFRHELVSALLLDANQHLVGDGIDADGDLVRYLVAAHHGRVRLAIRSIPGESDRSGGRRVALGVREGDVVPTFEVDGTIVPETTLDLGPMALGGSGSWTAMALALRDREDLGPFRLATLEALVRLADWRASSSPSVVASLAADSEAP